jgi:DNA-binding transcriptional MerR regulator
MADAELMTITPGSRVAEISTSYLRFLADRGQVPVARTSSGLRLFKRSDLEALRAERIARGASPTETQG